MGYKTDEYGEVLNAPETYDHIAQQLIIHNAYMVGWTDQHYTHFDILFTLRPPFIGGQIQGGLRPREDLFVSIMRIGSFGFAIKERGQYQPLHEGYVEEKLSGRAKLGQTTSLALAELINGVRKALIEREFNA